MKRKRERVKMLPGILPRCSRRVGKGTVESEEKKARRHRGQLKSHKEIKKR